MSETLTAPVPAPVTLTLFVATELFPFIPPSNKIVVLSAASKLIVPL